jgi:hypothetical protein
MYYNKFIKSLNGNNAVEHTRSFGHLIEKTEDGILIDGEKTSFKELEEARQYIKTQQYTKIAEEEIKTELYDEISENKIANIIKEHHDIRVTDTLIESYIELASSKLFTVDPVVQEIRSLNKLDKLIEGKIDYKLADGTIIAINEDTQQRLNELFNNQQEIIEHMRESKDNFISVLKQIVE